MQEDLKLIVKEELKKCIADPVYFMRTYCYIQHPQRGKIKFNLYPYQEDLLGKFVEDRFNIILKSRQTGISTLTSGFSLWYMLFQTDVNILVVATKEGVATELFSKVKLMYDLLPGWFKTDEMKTNYVTKNQHTLKLQNGSRINSSTCTSDSGRSQALSLLIIDECQTAESMVTVRNKILDEIRRVPIGELYNDNIYHSPIQFELNEKQITEWEIETPTGWSDFSSIKKTVKKEHLKIRYTNNSIGCSLRHKLKMKNGMFKYAKDIVVGEVLFTNDVVEQIDLIEGDIELFDVMNVEKRNEFYANGVVHHNCAFIPNNLVDDLWSGVFPTLSTGGRAIILSTPNGFGNFFHRTWVAAENKTNKFRTTKLHWTVHPERDQTWRDEQTAVLGVDKAAQECLSGDTSVTIKDGIVSKTISLQSLYESKIKCKILTPSGFVDFDKVQKTTKPEFIKLIFSDDTELKCSLDHPFVINNKIVNAIDINIGQKLNGNNKTVYLVDKIYFKESIDLYDVINVDKGHVFYANDIEVHNCDCNFLTSGHTVIENDILNFYRETILVDPVEYRGHTQDLWIYKYPILGRQYVIGADVARGDGTDYSGFHVIDAETLEQCAVFKGKIDPKSFGKLLVDIGTEYNEAIVAVENANMGWATVQEIINLGYSNLYYSQKNKTVIDKKDEKSKPKLVPGWSTTSVTRPLIIENLQKTLRDKLMALYCIRTLSELDVFIWSKSGKPQARQGYNDDLVMSLAIALWVIETNLTMTKRYAMNGITSNKAPSYPTLYTRKKPLTTKMNKYVQGLNSEHWSMNELIGKRK